MNGSTTLAANVYTYDGVGNRSANMETVNGVAINYAYSYDELKRLTQVTNGTPAQQENYQYDPLGNRTQRSVGQTGPSVTAYKFDNANELTEIHAGSLTGTLLATLTYDANGNLQTDGTRGYTWDALDQLAQVIGGTTTVSYAYDGVGRRLKKSVNGTLTQWLYDGDNLYAEYGASWTNPQARYSQAGLDQPLLRAQVNADGSNGTAQYMLADGLGSVVAMANSADSTTASQRFDAWGNKIAGSGTIPQYGYTGREPDETGLVYYRARYYSPGIGRFVSRDPAGLGGGINQYAYVGGNPVNRTDPSGLVAAPPQAAPPPSSYPSGCGVALNEGDDSETMSDAEGREGFDFSQGPVVVADGVCYPGDSGQRPAELKAWDPREGTYQYQQAMSLQEGMVNAGFAGIVKSIMGTAAKALGVGAEVAAVADGGLQSELVAAEKNLGLVPQGKTVAANQAAQRTLSGWTNTEGFVPSSDQVTRVMAKADDIGFAFKPHIFDQGVPGRYFASHAEPQLSLLSDTFAVSRDMCVSCRSFMSTRAVAEGRTYVVQDPTKIWTFSPQSTSWLGR